jgi:hypothetical protein
VAKPKQLDLLLHSDYDPQACFARLVGQIDVQKRTLFSFSGFKGSKPVIGFISGNEFSLQKRRFWRNDFAPVLYARVLPAMKGALIEAYVFRLPYGSAPVHAHLVDLRHARWSSHSSGVFTPRDGRRF